MEKRRVEHKGNIRCTMCRGVAVFCFAVRGRGQRNLMEPSIREILSAQSLSQLGDRGHTNANPTRQGGRSGVHVVCLSRDPDGLATSQCQSHGISANCYRAKRCIG